MPVPRIPASCRSCFVLACSLCLMSSGTAQASLELRKELAEAAKDIKQLLDARGDNRIGVGQFTTSPKLRASSGPGIALLLAEELKRAGVSVDTDSKFYVEGKYEDVIDARDELLAVRLKFAIIDGKTTKVITELERGVKGNTDIAQLLGVTVAPPLNGDKKERNQEIQKRIDMRQVHIAGSRVAADASSPFAIEVLVADKPREASDDKGRAFVQIKRDEIYAVRLINNSPNEVAVELTIDGLSMFAFSKLRDAADRPRYNRVVIAAGKSLLIKGWHRDNSVSDSFLVTEYAKSAAAKLPSTADVGTITASFAAAWPQGGTLPEGEPANGEKSGDATGFGPPVEAKFMEVKRSLGVNRATVSVRYTR